MDTQTHTKRQYDFYVARCMATENGKRVFISVSCRDDSEAEAMKNIKFKHPNAKDIEKLEITGYYT